MTILTIVGIIAVFYAAHLITKPIVQDDDEDCGVCHHEVIDDDGRAYAIEEFLGFLEARHQPVLVGEGHDPFTDVCEAGYHQMHCGDDDCGCHY